MFEQLQQTWKDVRYIIYCIIHCLSQITVLNFFSFCIVKLVILRKNLKLKKWLSETGDLKGKLEAKEVARKDQPATLDSDSDWLKNVLVDNDNADV